MQEQIENIDVKTDVLGISVMYSAYEEAHVDILKINSVHKDSPAFKAGLFAQTDYILGALENTRFIKFEAISIFAVYI